MIPVSQVYQYHRYTGITGIPVSQVSVRHCSAEVKHSRILSAGVSRLSDTSSPKKLNRHRDITLHCFAMQEQCLKHGGIKAASVGVMIYDFSNAEKRNHKYVYTRHVDSKVVVTTVTPSIISCYSTEIPMTSHTCQLSKNLALQFF